MEQGTEAEREVVGLPRELLLQEAQSLRVRCNGLVLQLQNDHSSQQLQQQDALEELRRCQTALRHLQLVVSLQQLQQQKAVQDHASSAANSAAVLQRSIIVQQASFTRSVYACMHSCMRECVRACD